MFFGGGAWGEKEGVRAIGILETVDGSDPLPFVGYREAGGQSPRVLRQEIMKIIMFHGLLSEHAGV